MTRPRLIVWTLNINDYQPAIRELTYPFIRLWCQKIGAEHREITERKYPDWPVVYEKLQLHTLGEQSEWTIYFDADALIHPDMMDPTNHMSKDTVAHNGRDMAGNRWRYDQYFRRDGRHWGSCNWCSIASEWCLDLWHPLDIPLNRALQQIFPIVNERRVEQGGHGFIDRDHLIDDFTLSRNIARYGLKATTLMDLYGSLGNRDQAGNGFNPHLFHLYNVPEKKKLRILLHKLSAPRKISQQQAMQFDLSADNPAHWGNGWELMSPKAKDEFEKKWKIT